MADITPPLPGTTGSQVNLQTTTLDPIIQGADNGADSIPQQLDSIMQAYKGVQGSMFNIQSLITEMAALFAKTRDKMQESEVQQRSQAAALQISGLQQKMDGIEKQAEAGYLEAGMQIGASVLQTTGGAMAGLGGEGGKMAGDMLTGAAGGYRAIGQAAGANLNAKGQTDMVSADNTTNIAQQEQSSSQTAVDNAKQCNDQIISSMQGLLQSTSALLDIAKF
ncbi:MAG: hypothetical protein ACRC5A_03595 [Enterobacteriaceae bacterium]